MTRDSWIAQYLVAEASIVGTKKKGTKSYNHMRENCEHNRKVTRFKSYSFGVQRQMDVNTDKSSLPNGRETPIYGEKSEGIRESFYKSSKKNSSKCIIYLEIIGILSTMSVAIILAVFRHRKESLLFEFPFRRMNDCFAIFIIVEVALSLVGLICICDFAWRMGWLRFISSGTGKIKSRLTNWKFSGNKQSSNCLTVVLEFTGFLSLIGTAVVLAVLYHNKQTISFEFPFRRTNRRFAVFVAIELLLAIAWLGCVFGFLKRIRSTKFMSKSNGSVEVANAAINHKYQSNDRWEQADTQTRNDLWKT